MNMYYIWPPLCCGAIVKGIIKQHIICICTLPRIVCDSQDIPVQIIYSISHIKLMTDARSAKMLNKHYICTCYDLILKSPAHKHYAYIHVLVYNNLPSYLSGRTGKIAIFLFARLTFLSYSPFSMDHWLFVALQVWAIDNRRQVYTRKGVTDDMPIGEEWVHVPGVCGFLPFYPRFR